MICQEDFILDKKYLNLIHKSIYSVDLDMFGMISEIAVTDYGMYLKACFNKIHNDRMILFEDFKNGKIKFVIITNIGISDKLESQFKDKDLQDIKNFLGDDFSEDKIIYQTNDKYKEEIRRKDKLEVFNIENTLLNLKKLSAEIFYDDYTILELYKKYVAGIITETELLYGVCNYLCQEIKRLKDDNLNYFIEKFNHEQKEILIEYKSRKKEVDEKGEKIINDKEKMFEMLDVMAGMKV